MNERIKELYEQAHIEHRQEYFSSVVDPTITSVSVTRHFNPEKFAELIIEEINKINYEVDFLHTTEKVSLENKYNSHFGIGK